MPHLDDEPDPFPSQLQAALAEARAKGFADAVAKIVAWHRREAEGDHTYAEKDGVDKYDQFCAEQRAETHARSAAAIERGLYEASK